MKHKLWIVCISVCCIFFWSCSNSTSLEEDHGEGTLEVQVQFNLNRDPILYNSVISSTELVSSGTITLTNDDDSYNFPLSISSGTASAQINNLDLGSWDILVKLYDDEEALMMTGTSNAVIEQGELTSVTVTVHYISGSLDVSLNLPAIQAGYGYQHSMILTLDGTLFTAGGNAYGQLGYATNNDDNSLEFQASLVGVKDIVNLYQSTLAIKSDGTLYGVGRNHYGSMGTGSNSSVDTWTEIEGISDVLNGDSAFFATILVKTDGTAWYAGLNTNGRFGDGTDLNNGMVTSWTQLSVTDVKAVALGSSHTLVLKNNGELWAAGYNEYGQLGLSSEYVNVQTSFVKVMDDVAAIAADGFSSFVLKENGEVYGAGYNYGNAFAQEDDSTLNNGFIFIEAGVKKIDFGNYRSFIIKDDNSLWVAGTSFSGEYLKIDDNVKFVHGSYSGFLYGTFDGDVYGWGTNSNGQLGIGGTDGYTEPGSILIFGD